MQQRNKSSMIAKRRQEPAMGQALILALDAGWYEARLQISHRYWNTKLLNKALTLDMNRTEQLNFHQQDKVLRPDSGSQQRSTGRALPLENPVLKGRIHLLCACVRATQLTDTWECLGLPFPGVHRKCGMSRNALGRFIQFVSHPNSSWAGSSYWQYQHCSGMDFTLINY